MFTIEKSFRFSFENEYEIQLLLNDGIYWLRLSCVPSKDLLVYWSTSADNTDAISFDHILLSLVRRLQRVNEIDYSNDDAIEYWPEGWDNWGRGIPEPISDFAEAPEFLKAIERVTRQMTPNT